MARSGVESNLSAVLGTGRPEANCRSVGKRTRFGGELRRACDAMSEARKSLVTLAWW
ncbi:MAG: hypothetical protein Q8S00_31100 [Deltaproteobacteria bacterium]|nr:hypothetical protein [Deltaproteobacteria bacterium]